MNKVDGQRVIEVIEGYYHRKLENSEIKALAEEMKDFTYEMFEQHLKFPLLKRIDYFTIAKLHQLIEEYRELEKLKHSLGISSFDELYEN